MLSLVSFVRNAELSLCKLGLDSKHVYRPETCPDEKARKIAELLEGFGHATKLAYFCISQLRELCGQEDSQDGNPIEASGDSEQSEFYVE